MPTLLTTYDRRFSRAVESHVENDWKDISTWDAPKCSGARRFCEGEWNFLSMAKNSQWKIDGKLIEPKHPPGCHSFCRCLSRIANPARGMRCRHSSSDCQPPLARSVFENRGYFLGRKSLPQNAFDIATRRPRAFHGSIFVASTNLAYHETLSRFPKA
jgi:hypothetical protein